MSFDERSYGLIVIAVLAFIIIAFGPWTSSFWKKVWSHPDSRYRRIRMSIFVIVAISAVIKLANVLLA
jgi:hypothetical protein